MFWYASSSFLFSLKPPTMRCARVICEQQHVETFQTAISHGENFNNSLTTLTLTERDLMNFSFEVWLRTCRGWFWWFSVQFIAYYRSMAPLSFEWAWNFLVNSLSLSSSCLNPISFTVFLGTHYLICNVELCNLKLYVR